ncbi:MAG: HAMP domain-containing histidine kinase [Betaproteobacteria bacterium]|nr:HAMP domain-containing histidine kinase [Betaproteobacteria bacterium]
MKRLLDLSLRHKIPLWGSGLIVAATLAVSVGLMARAFADLKGDVIISSQGLGRTLAKTLFPVLLHDDLWRAIELVEAPLHGSTHADPLQAEAIFVVDPKMRVLVSSTPRTMPLLAELDSFDPDDRQLAAALRDADTSVSHAFEFGHSDYLHVTTPVAEEGSLIGTLVITHSKHVFLPRFFGIALGGAGMGALVLAILLPLNWYWGRHMAQPLVQLSRGMDEMVRGVPSEINPDLYGHNDELGQLFDAYREASAEIRQKAALEREVLQSERLAAVGRLAAGIAHEVNNPLAGMLMALDNLKRRSAGDPPLDPLLERTLAFLERGLQHVSETVGALLLEARVQLRPLTPHDFEDLRTLLEPQLANKSLRFDWAVRVPDSIAVAASLVRQILINLLLNAVQATPAGGGVRLAANMRDDTLSLQVSNDGEPPPAHILAHIFEPFVSGREGGHGLGLWVAYQTVQQLGGHIAIDSADGRVVFRVRLPVVETP